MYVNPAYAMANQKNGAAGIERHLEKLIETDVGERGCTLIALLPNLSHTEWHERFVGVGRARDLQQSAARSHFPTLSRMWAR